MTNPTNLLISFIQTTVLAEAPRWKRERVSIPHAFQTVKEKYLDQEWIFFTLVHINKTGIYPRSSESDGPLGIYCYPLVEKTYQQLWTGDLPVASTRPFVRFFEIKQPKKVLVVGEGFGYASNLSQEEAEKLIEKLTTDPSIATRLSLTKEIVERIINQHFDRKLTPAQQIYKITKYLASKKAIDWTFVLRRLGFIGVADFGGNIIYRGEPDQAVFFSPADIIDLETIPNPRFEGHPKVGPLGIYDSGSENGKDHYKVNYSDKGRGMELSAAKTKYEFIVQKFLDENPHVKTRENIFTNKEYITDLLKYMRFAGGNTQNVYKLIFDQIPKEWLPDFISLTDVSEPIQKSFILSLKPEDLHLLFSKKLTVESTKLLIQKIEKIPGLFKQYIEKADVDSIYSIIPYINPANLINFVHHPDLYVRREVVKYLPSKDLPLMMADESEEVREHVAQRINYKFLIKMAENEYSTRVNSEIVDRISDKEFETNYFLSSDLVAIWAAGKVSRMFAEGDSGEESSLFLEKIFSKRKNRYFSFALFNKLPNYCKRRMMPIVEKLISVFGPSEQMDAVRNETDWEMLLYLYHAFSFSIFGSAIKLNINFKAMSIHFFKALEQEDLIKFINLPNHEIRLNLAKALNPTNVGLLVNDKFSFVREVVAKKTNDVEVLKQLVSYGDSASLIAHQRLGNK